ncbi:ABC transporter ATP-binding protein [Neiella marina]|uniref:ABC transporter ATP-binding protein n=1 Tax=Neiella marina TaxID=508461 RepID=A0A8J2XPE4_9GAMM|nr:ABC transporter ATP-binding protein [Neiella marina]GGA79476.1 ABC transporter ATP-binding protein [Neiella marina]
MLELETISHWFESSGATEPGQRVLNNISLTLHQGESLALMGNSGSGKSTLLQIAAGLERPQMGQVKLTGELLYQLADKRLSALRREKIGFVFQQFNLLPGLTVVDNILFQSRLSKRAVDQQWLNHLMAELSIEELKHRLPEQLSGGQQQRVAIARAIAHKPCIVFADEPTGNLNDSLSHSVMALLIHLVQEANSSLLMVTHSAAMADYADSVLKLQQSQLIAAATA